MRQREVVVERFGNFKLPLGGKYEYVGVRGKQGRSHDKFQGCTPKKTHFTRLCDTPQEAAVALATLKGELANGYDPAEERKPRKRRGGLIGTCHLVKPRAVRPFDLVLSFASCVHVRVWQKRCRSRSSGRPPSHSRPRGSSRSTILSLRSRCPSSIRRVKPSTSRRPTTFRSP